MNVKGDSLTLHLLQSLSYVMQIPMMLWKTLKPFFSPCQSLYKRCPFLGLIEKKSFLKANSFPHYIELQFARIRVKIFYSSMCWIVCILMFSTQFFFGLQPFKSVQLLTWAMTSISESLLLFSVVLMFHLACKQMPFQFHWGNIHKHTRIHTRTHTHGCLEVLGWPCQEITGYSSCYGSSGAESRRFDKTFR